jgi:hypothetical protein
MEKPIVAAVFALETKQWKMGEGILRIGDQLVIATLI